MRGLQSLRTRWRWLIAVSLPLILLAACTVDTPPQPPTTAGVELVAPEFAAYYEANGGLLTFGFPITRAFFDERGRRIQYFQNMLLVTEDNGQTITAAPLGEWALEQSELAADVSVEPAEGFQSFYEINGGAALYGPALTGLTEEAGRRVQYFRNAKFEWHPEEL